MPEISLSGMNPEKPSVLNILAKSGLFESKGQIRRLISQGAVKLDAERVEDAELMVAKSSSIIKAGKKIFLRVVN